MSGKIIEDISMQGHTVLVLTNANKLFFWGYNETIQLGNGTAGTSVTQNWLPIEVNTAQLAGKAISKIIAGFGWLMVLAADSLLYSWGENRVDQTGQGFVPTAPVTVQRLVLTTDDLAGSGIEEMHMGKALRLLLLQITKFFMDI